MTGQSRLGREELLKRKRYLDKMSKLGRPVYVSAEPARQHLLLLRERLTLREISELCGVSLPYLSKISQGRMKTISGEKYFNPIMATEVPFDTPVDAEWRMVATRRISLGLARAGWPSRYIADDLGTSVETVRTWHNCSRNMTPGRDRFLRLVALAKRLECTSPARMGVAASIWKGVRSRAESSGYAPLSVWDWDSIGDPAAVPEWTGACGSMEGHAAHRRTGIPTCDACRLAHLQYKKTGLYTRADGTVNSKGDVVHGRQVSIFSDPVMVDRVMQAEFNDVPRGIMAVRFGVSKGTLNRFIAAERKRRGWPVSMGRPGRNMSKFDA